MSKVLLSQAQVETLKLSLQITAFAIVGEDFLPMLGFSLVEV